MLGETVKLSNVGLHCYITCNVNFNVVAHHVRYTISKVNTRTPVFGRQSCARHIALFEI